MIITYITTAHQPPSFLACEEIPFHLVYMDSDFGSGEMKYVQYEQVFKHFDDNGDGKLSASELHGHCGGMTLEDAEAAVESLDSDGDGLLELGDLVRLLEGVEEEERVNDLREAFKMYENDGCGYITSRSLKRMLSRLGESRSTDECSAMISRFDLNGDGVLTFDEFKVMML